MTDLLMDSVSQWLEMGYFRDANMMLHGALLNGKNNAQDKRIAEMIRNMYFEMEHWRNEDGHL